MQLEWTIVSLFAGSHGGTSLGLKAIKKNAIPTRSRHYQAWHGHRCAWDFPPEGGYFPAQHVAGLLQLCRGGKCWAMKLPKGGCLTILFSGGKTLS